MPNTKNEAPPAPPAPAAPHAPSGGGSSPRRVVPKATALNLSSGFALSAHRVLLFGPGGVGKSTLASYLPAPIFLDVEDGTRGLEVVRDTSARDWLALRGKLAEIAQSPPEGYLSIVIDSATAAQELAKDYVVETRKTEKGDSVRDIEGFGWGRGWGHVAEEWNGLLADLDRIVERGLNVCLIAHDVAAPAPNPEGDEYQRWVPSLYGGTKAGASSMRNRTYEWSDHAVFLRFDVFTKDGKATGAGTRTAYTSPLATHVAKSRTKLVSLPFTAQDPGALWRELRVLPTS